MQSVNIKPYYCFHCTKTVPIKLPDLICPECSQDFLQEANISEIEPVSVTREIPFIDIISIFSETRDPGEIRRRILARLSEAEENMPDSRRPFGYVLRELIERSNQPAPASDEDIENLEKVILEKDEDEECKICADNFKAGEEKYILECQHEFHSNCLEPWLKIKSSCPVCRQDF